MSMSNKTYDILKKVVLIIGYIVTFILSLTDIWGFPYGAQIAATVSAVGILLGAALTVSSKTYHKEDEKDVDVE